MNSSAHAVGGQDQARFSLARLWPLAVLALAIGAVFVLNLDRFLTFDALREHRETLTAFVADNTALAALCFVAVYAAAIALSVPGGAVLTIAGGFMFGSLLGTGLVVVAATLGATLVFLIAKTALGDPLRAKAGPFLKRMEAGFQDDALNYLLVLRLIPLFPFWIVNLVPAFLGVPLRTYVLGTFIGIIPGSFVFASVGAGLGSVLDSGQEFSPASVLTPQIVIALVGLAVLALLPVAYRKLKERRT
ncbi:MAG TPA: TVP38/TMEM64 family protein [Geminicoccaceae bacterium]|nr:TVP38/TMEM64 family protein [Geminicoccaceae bacterium]